MNRFFVQKDQIKDNNIIIKEDDVKHIKNVLRLKINDKIEVCSFDKFNYIANICEIEKDFVKANIIKKIENNNEPHVNIVLYQGLPKFTKMDFIVKKCTEIGIKKIYPLITKRTVVKICDHKKANKKLQRWNKISEEAAKQSKRNYIPQIGNIIQFEEMIKLLKKEDYIIVPYENEKNVHLKNIINGIKVNDANKINIIIGPEGGFEKEEILKLKNIGAESVSLGSRILRTETAGIVVLSILLYELGDL